MSCLHREYKENIFRKIFSENRKTTVRDIKSMAAEDKFFKFFVYFCSLNIPMFPD